MNIAYLAHADERRLSTWYGRYLDTYERRGDEWRILHRVCVHHDDTTELGARFDGHRLLQVPSGRVRPASKRPTDRTLMPRFAKECAALDPTGFALVDGDREMSWTDVDDAVLNRCANLLLAADREGELGSEHRIAVFAENAAETALAHLGDCSRAPRRSR